MHTPLILSVLVSVAVAFPQDISVVRPNHFLPAGAFQNPSAGNAQPQHLLPESFYNLGQQVEQNKNVQGAAQQPQAVVAAALQQEVPGQTQSAAESAAPDSYSNIGGASGRVASALSFSNEYGEILPKAFSNLDQDSYAYYQGHKN